jgi:hypothetical protein
VFRIDLRSSFGSLTSLKGVSRKTQPVVCRSPAARLITEVLLDYHLRVARVDRRRRGFEFPVRRKRRRGWRSSSRRRLSGSVHSDRSAGLCAPAQAPRVVECLLSRRDAGRVWSDQAAAGNDRGCCVDGNRCHYCMVLHGAALRKLSGDPILVEQLRTNYKYAQLEPRERAMLDFCG